MPRVTQYIRDEDLEKWKAIENKSLWIHERLNSPPTVPFYASDFKAMGPSLPTPRPHVETSLPPGLKTKFCKNGHPIPYPRDKCLGKGCQYA